MKRLLSGLVGPALALTLVTLARGQSVEVPVSPETVPPAAPNTETDPEPAQVEWVQLFRYSERLSRSAFESCDGNSDDRISIFEAAKAIYGMHSVRDGETFRTIDSNSDGYMQWPEFDRRFQQLTSRGSALLVRPIRPLEKNNALSKSALTPEQQSARRLVGILDQDGDGRLTTDEAIEVTSDVGLPENLLHLFKGLDVDGSGDISEQEILPVARFLPSPESKDSGGKESQLPPGFNTADSNGDGSLDAPELEGVLGQIDPALVRWASQIVKDADRSNNGSLGPLEIRQAVRRDEEAPPAVNPITRKNERKARGMRG